MLQTEKIQLAIFTSFNILANNIFPLKRALYAYGTRSLDLIIYTRKQNEDSIITIVFSPNFKWISLLLASLAIILSYINMPDIALLSFSSFLCWLILFLWQTKGVRQEIKEFTILDKVKCSGSNWNYKNPITYTISLD